VLGEVQIRKCEITVPVCVLEGTETRASEMTRIFSSPAEMTGIFG
jgi:hypothetical protein